uniref:hypothetical protein n=1 Tax=Fluviicola sp. TaxID=1917219 RepID=UPI00404B01DE
MDRIKRFQRTLIITLTGLNTFVYCVSSDFPWKKTLLFTFISFIIAGISVLAFVQSKRVLKQSKTNPK